MAKRKTYEDLHLMPHLIAERVCGIPYTGQELSSPPSWVDKIEKRRQNMTNDDVHEFSQLADQRCKAAYEIKADWFMKCVRSKTNAGRDQLYVWLTHWLASYLMDPSLFREKLGWASESSMLNGV